MGDKNEIEEHESYGMIGFSRVSSSCGMNFFGSSVRSSHFIVLNIKRGGRRRDLNHYWYHGREELIRLRLSSTQFAELLTTMNIGDGVPCTLERVGVDAMADCPAVDQRQKYEDEFKETMNAAGRDIRALQVKVNQLLSGERINKAQRQEIKAALQSTAMRIDDSAPWVHKQFNEAMDKTVTEAKGEVEAFVNHKIHSLGINALNTEILAALEAPLDSEPLQLRPSDSEGA